MSRAWECIYVEESIALTACQQFSVNWVASYEWGVSTSRVGTVAFEFGEFGCSAATKNVKHLTLLAAICVRPESFKMSTDPIMLRPMTPGIPVIPFQATNRQAPRPAAKAPWDRFKAGEIKNISFLGQHSADTYLQTPITQLFSLYIQYAAYVDLQSYSPTVLVRLSEFEGSYFVITVLPGSWADNQICVNCDRQTQLSKRVMRQGPR